MSSRQTETIHASPTYSNRRKRENNLLEVVKPSSGNADGVILFMVPLRSPGKWYLMFSLGPGPAIAIVTFEIDGLDFFDHLN